MTYELRWYCPSCDHTYHVPRGPRTPLCPTCMVELARRPRGATRPPPAERGKWSRRRTLSADG